ncbi:enoyl-CoA hydratase/isomerase family protein [Cognatishimia sp. WU-CL00825]|uniref:enoyl-CoA hydratase/isomerase family protein n=1 Tax=Cognatishimia sp. WU-CL00825 TaxID=3127658 RepID=UPI00310AD27B
MTDLNIRKSGKTGRITFTRPKALNALSYQMSLDIEAALDDWALDDDVTMLVIDAAGEKAFCAGGDIADIYAAGTKGDYAFGQKFWADEYRMNAKMFAFPKPVATFMQGFTMGGGVGVGCHGSHRVVGDSSQIAMPEVGIGLVPDVGGSYILAKAPDRFGEYLGLTAARMGAADAILAGFADYYIPEALWPELIMQLEHTGNYKLIDAAATPAPEGQLEAIRSDINMHFAGETLADILRSLSNDPSEFTQKTLKVLNRNSPLSMACALELIHRNRGATELRTALQQEYRFTYRALEKSDLIEGIRAAIIDKDRNPQWQHSLEALPTFEVTQMLLPLGKAALTFEKEEHA